TNALISTVVMLPMAGCLVSNEQRPRSKIGSSWNLGARSTFSGVTVPWVGGSDGSGDGHVVARREYGSSIAAPQVCVNCGLSAPRLSQHRKGTTIHPSEPRGHDHAQNCTGDCVSCRAACAGACAESRDRGGERKMDRALQQGRFRRRRLRGRICI